MKKRLMVSIPILVLFVLFIGCTNKDPIGIEQFQLAFPDSSSSPAINSSVLTDGIDFSIGYYNGNIRTDRISFEWQASTDEEFLCYKIFKAIGQYEDDPTFEHIETFNDQGNTTFIDSTLIQDQYYIYKIATIFNNGTHITDDIEIKTPKWQAPGNITINGLSTTIIELAWEDNTESETGFMIYVDTLTTVRQFVTIDSFTTGQDVTSWLFDDLPTTPVYRFSVKAVGDWEEETQVSESTPFVFSDLVFDPPDDLTLDQESGTIAVILNWQDNSNLETGFEVERKINSADFELIATISTYNAVEYTDYDTTSFNYGDTLTYRVRAYNDYQAIIYTPYSNEESIIIVEPSGNQTTISVTVDNYPGEASWNLFCHSTSSYYFPTDQTFSYNYENQVFTIGLDDGHYAVHCWDTFGDGGISGIVTDDESNILVEWDDNDYNYTGHFHFWVNQ